MAVWSADTATMCVALLLWICGTVWLLDTAARTERGLWAIRKGRPRVTAVRRKPLSWR